MKHTMKTNKFGMHYQKPGNNNKEYDVLFVSSNNIYSNKYYIPKQKKNMYNNNNAVP